VIIYENDIATLNTLKSFFATRGYEVYAYNDPQVCPLHESLANSCEKNYLCADLVISEFKLPNMTGIELFQLQSKRGCRLENKMKAISSFYSDDELLKMCNDMGCKFFKKPFEVPALAGWVTECEKLYDLSQPLNDKRRRARQAFTQVIEYYVNPASSHEKFIGITLDKSNEGLGLRIFSPLRVGDEITILKRFETTKQKGIVMWCNKKGKTIYRAGLRLLSD
jgi:CheY-like chemotaxis protein